MIEKKLIIASCISILVSACANASVLIPAKGMSVLYVNGQPADSKIRENALQVGSNQLVVRMDKDLGRGNSSDVFTSSPYILSFEAIGDEIKLDHPVARSKSEAEKAFKKQNPDWRLTQDGNKLAYQQELLQGKNGLLPFMEMDKLVKEHNDQRGITFVDGALVTATTTAIVASPVTTQSDTPKLDVKTAPSVVESVTQNVEQLKAWYLKASKKERKEFRKWMIDQE
ncbi:DUF2057 domain-containing protein [Vibrio splendidus]|uniref:YccT family protein n=1 Tax=Vibrio splendidus TaxID=29497 RepID=UPI001FB24191|nr:DUF2057 domain-containing protein [Vibrio splendidus]UOE79253.1 DUF2057 domain-containing protein [Vibrio splendidus]